MEWLENLIFFVCVFGCFIGIFCYGKWTMRQQRPIGFWANLPFDKGRIQDVRGYNHAYGRLMLRFSVAPGIAGIAVLISGWVPVFLYVAMGVLILWSTLGIWWLISCYKRIEKQYILQ